MKRTEILTITDRSGSMESIRADVIGGFNRFVAEQQAEPGEARLTYCQFDAMYEVVYTACPLSAVPPLTEATFVPRGSTALYDAIGRTLNEQGARIAAEGWAELVVVQIITDGMENASREFGAAQVKSMIEHAEKHGWVFLFLAANQDAFASGAALGISGGTTASYSADAVGTAHAYGATSAMTSSLRAGQAAPTLQAVMDAQLRGQA
ncbi:MAG: hypothetical protein ACXWVD_00575 [Telluria sp.]